MKMSVEKSAELKKMFFKKFPRVTHELFSVVISNRTMKKNSESKTLFRWVSLASIYLEYKSMQQRQQHMQPSRSISPAATAQQLQPAAAATTAAAKQQQLQPSRCSCRSSAADAAQQQLHPRNSCRAAAASDQQLQLKPIAGYIL